MVIVEKRACSAAAAAGSCRLGTTERSAPISAMLKNTYIVPSTNATIAICAKESRWSAIATTMLVTRADADEVGDDHHALAVNAVDGDAGEEAEERPREDAREADDARLDRRMRHREHEQRIGDPGRLGADRRERLPDLEQDEVAVLAERQERPCQAASATSTSTTSRRRVSRYVAASRTAAVMITISIR